MDVTERTLEQVLIDVLQSGNLRLIMLCSFLVGLAIGAVLVALYFTKIRYYSLMNELKQAKDKLTQAEHKRDKYKDELEDLKTHTKDFQDAEYARLATKPDVVLLPPDED